jgi:serine/threonine-protein kinase
LSLIGSGAMGSVYLAEDAVGRRVALKILIPELDQDERFRQRFLREAELAAGLDHPHVVPTLASGEEDGRLYLAMAYVEGADLRAVLRREGRLEPTRALDLLGQVAGALDAAHAAGLVHRDVKPGNILVAGDEGAEQAYVCDFGLARHASSASSLTGDRGFVGTIDYVPPEQIEGGKIDGRADAYSLGCVLYECLAGVRPFDRESELSVVFAHLNEPPPRITDTRPELPEPLDDVFATALAKDPDERYATCRELIEAAQATRRGKRVSRHRSRQGRVLAAACVVAVSAAAIGGILATRGGDSKGVSSPAITQTSITGARIGLTSASYQHAFGNSGVLVVQPQSNSRHPSTNWPTLSFDNQKVRVVFGNKNGATTRATIITTWNRNFRTSRGIGPCSTVAALFKAYGRSVSEGGLSQEPRDGYKVGKNLYFSAARPVGRDLNPQTYITAVALFDGSAPGAEQPYGSGPFAGFVTDWETPKCHR